MQTQITVSLSYDFRGETYCYSATIPLPLFIDNVEAFYRSIPQIIADKNQLDTFTYQYELMEVSPVEVVAMHSCIAKALPELPILLADFLAHYNRVGLQAYLQLIAAEYELDVNADPRLAKALKAAYNLGAEQKVSSQKNSTTDWMQHCFG